jgi:hypothetical protein
MSDSYDWRLTFSGLGLPAGCASVFEKAPTKTPADSEALAGFPVLLASEDSFEHMLSVGDWKFIDSGGGAFQPSYAIPNLHESTTWPMESLFLPWLCQFAAEDQLVCTIKRDQQQTGSSIYAVDGSAVYVSAAENDLPNIADLAPEALKAAVGGDLISGEGELVHEETSLKVRALHWSLIEGDLA